jgi:succinoglycan biosynthesis protein ExoA
MKDNPLITIIIPTLNEEKHLSNCLKSVFSQTYPANLTEVYVIDGGSTDKTVEIIKDYQHHHDNLFLLNNRKRIQAAAFNLGVDRAKGELIIRLDAHCYYDPNYVHYCVLNHLEADYGNVGGCWIVIPGSNTLMGKTIALVNSSPFGLGGATYRVGRIKKLVQTVPFGAFPIKILSIIGRMDENMLRGEDNEYNARIIKAGYKILFDPKIKAHYYSRDNLRTFLKQMYNNGFSIGVLIRNTINSVNLRHIIPLFFTLFITIGLILSFAFPVIRTLFLSTLAIYFLFDIVFGIIATIKKQLIIIPLFVYAVFLVHFFYGLGTIVGLFKGRYEII